jgi:release factor glutamine methyltransferase
VLEDVLSSAARALAASSDSARADALLLLAHVLGRSREWILAHGDEPLSDEDIARYRALCAERARGVPVAYLLGSAWFYGREFIVDRRVLIPRPETEHLVEEAVAFLKTRPQPTALDVGAGSGAIAGTIAAEVPNAFVDATDASLDALAVAAENIRRLNVADRVTLHHGDLTQRVDRKTFDAIVANLPYVPTSDIAHAPDPVSFEPRAALDGGPDGLDLYRRLLPALRRLVKPAALVLLEAAPPLMAPLEAIARGAFPDAPVDRGSDYGGRERYVRIRVAS